MKNRALKVSYIRTENGKLVISIYHGNIHIGTIEVNEFDCMTVFRGIENRAPVFVKYLKKEAFDGQSREVLH